MNEFLEEHWDDMRTFLQKVSNPDSELEMARFDGYVDLPLQLAVLHSLLVDIISPMKLVIKSSKNRHTPRSATEAQPASALDSLTSPMYVLLVLWNTIHS